MKNTVTYALALVVGAVMLFATGMPSAALAAGGVATVKTLDGEATIIRGDQRMPAALGSTIEQNDAVETSATGSVGLLFEDDTQLSLGPNSRATIDEFVYNPDQSGSFVAKLWKGTLGFITGKVGKTTPENVRVETPLATIGIRGTSFVVSVDE